MSRRFLLILVLAAAGFALAAPAALAAPQKCAPPPPSAVNVYVEQMPTSCGSTVAKKPAHHASKPATVQPTSHPTTSVGPVVRPKLQKPHRHHPVSTPLKRNAHHPLPLTRTSAPSKPPSAVGAAFDLGSGPTTLFAALLAAAALLAVGGGLQHRRR